MTYDEYKAVVDGIVSAPDTLAAGALNLLDNLKTDLESADSLKATLAERETKIRELQDTNTQLYLRLTSNAAPTPQEKTPEQNWDEMMAVQFKEGKAI